MLDATLITILNNVDLTFTEFAQIFGKLPKFYYREKGDLIDPNYDYWLGLSDPIGISLYRYQTGNEYIPDFGRTNNQLKFESPTQTNVLSSNTSQAGNNVITVSATPLVELLSINRGYICEKKIGIILG